MHQMVSLLQCGDGTAASGVFRKLRVKDLVVQVEALYLPWISDASATENTSSTPTADGTIATVTTANGAAAAAATVASTTVPTDLPPRGRARARADRNGVAGRSSDEISGDAEGIGSGGGGGGVINAATDAGATSPTAGAEGEAIVDSGTAGSVLERAGKKFLPALSLSLSPRPTTTTTATLGSIPGTSGNRASPQRSRAPSPEECGGGDAKKEVPTLSLRMDAEDVPPRLPAPLSGAASNMRERLAALRAGAAGGSLSPPRMSIVTKPFRRAVNKINVAMSAAEEAISSAAGTAPAESSKSSRPADDACGAAAAGAVAGAILEAASPGDGERVMASSPEPGGE